MVNSRREEDISSIRVAGAFIRLLVNPAILLAVIYMFWGLEKKLDQHDHDIQFNRMTSDSIAKSLGEITRIVVQHNAEAAEWKYEIVKNIQFRENCECNGTGP